MNSFTPCNECSKIRVIKFLNVASGKSRMCVYAFWGKPGAPLPANGVVPGAPFLSPGHNLVTQLRG